jgi:hypothetical protein
MLQGFELIEVYFHTIFYASWRLKHSSCEATCYLRNDLSSLPDLLCVQVRTSFVSLLQVKDVTAQGLLDALLGLLCKLELPLEKLLGFGSDGASVMTG